MTKKTRERTLLFTIIIGLLIVSLLAGALFIFEKVRLNSIRIAALQGKSFEQKTRLIPVNIRNLELNERIKVLLNDPNKIEKVYEEVYYFTGNHRISEAIITSCISYDVPIGLAMGIAWTESRFNHLAINDGNSNGTADYGLFQLNDVNIENLTSDEYFNIERNTTKAIEILFELIDYYDNNIILVIASYNAGQTGIKDGISYETLFYLNNVLLYKDEFEKRLNEFLLNL